MHDRRDPIEENADESRDLYDVATWEERSSLDGLAVALHWLGVTAARAIIVLLALAILAAQLFLGGLGAQLADPIAIALVVGSVIPALALAAYIWYADVTTGEPLSLLVITFMLAVIFANFAAVVNGYFRPVLEAVPVVGVILFFFLVVGPIEEFVKWLAIRLHAFRSERFDSVIDGAVYGAVAGLGFATIENALYITRQFGVEESGTALIGAAGATAVARALAGPGHVIYSAFAGYYLGLAKFNPANAGPIVIKGLILASVIHATYNTLVGVVPNLLAVFLGVNIVIGIVGFMIGYNLLFGYALYRKLARYRRVYRDVNGSPERAQAAEDSIS